MAGYKQTWNAGALAADIAAAVSRAGRATMADCAAQAQQPGHAPRDTGRMATNITFGQDDPHTFWFGNVTEAYAWKQETDTTLNHPNGQAGFLRGAADAHFPDFGARLKEEMP